MTRRALRLVVIARQHAIGGTEQRREAEVDEIDARDAEGDIAVGDDTSVEQFVHEIEHGRLGCFEDDVGSRALGHLLHYSWTNVYGGHGPVSVTP